MKTKKFTLSIPVPSFDKKILYGFIAGIAFSLACSAGCDFVAWISDDERQEQREDGSVQSWVKENLPSSTITEQNDVSKVFVQIVRELEIGKLVGFRDSKAELKANIQPIVERVDDWNAFIDGLYNEIKKSTTATDELIKQLKLAHRAICSMDEHLPAVQILRKSVENEIPDKDGGSVDPFQSGGGDSLGDETGQRGEEGCFESHQKNPESGQDGNQGGDSRESSGQNQKPTQTSKSGRVYPYRWWY